MTDITQAAAITHVRPFADWLTQQRKGALNIEAAQALAELVEAVRETGKDGALTLTIKVEHSKGNALIVTDKVNVKLPEHTRESVLWWADDAGNLTRRDPNQPELPLGPQAVPDHVDPTTGEIRHQGATPA